jgi:hypothetical protein
VIAGAILSLVAAFIAVLIISVWEEMDVEDEPKKLIIEIAGSMRNTQQRFWSLPGVKGVHTRLKGSETNMSNSS